MRIGDAVLDLGLALDASLFSGAAETAAQAARRDLRDLMSLGNAHASALRGSLSDLLAADGGRTDAVAACLVPVADVAMTLPVEPRNFTDFLTSSFHKVRLSPKGTLDPNFKSLPLAYHSRASSVRVSGGAIVRPRVQQASGADVVFAPTRELDFELELGAFIGPGNPLGTPIAIARAPEHIFGHCLLNDWSARDIQRWESLPLGPFLAKSLSTSLSPWIVTQEALLPFRVPASVRPPGDPHPFDYLTCDEDQAQGGLDIALEVWLRTRAMREAGLPATRITAANFRHMYWTFAQMVTHHASNGCNLLPADLLGSGTVSGPEPESRACLAELTERGRAPLDLPGGETRAWLDDGDEVTLRARATRDGFVPIGFGDCIGTIAAAIAWPGAERSTQGMVER